MYVLLRIFCYYYKTRTSWRTMSKWKSISYFLPEKKNAVTISCIGIPLFVLLWPQGLIFVQHTVNWPKIHGILFFGSFELRHCVFARMRYSYTVAVNGKYWYPSFGFVVPSIADFRSMYRKLVEIPPYSLVWQFWIRTSLELVFIDGSSR